MADSNQASGGGGSAADPVKEGEGAAGTVENSTPPDNMRCVTLTGYGGIRMVKVQNNPEVKPKEGELLIRVKAW